MKKNSKLALAALAAALGGCANWAPPATVDYIPEGSSSYVYGDFSINAKPNLFGQYQSIGLNLKCSDGISYVIRFRAEKTLQVIPVKPSVCSVSEIVFTNVDNVIKGRKSFPQKILQEIDLKPGIAYYLGDYKGETSLSVDGRMINLRWQITSFRDKYSETTVGMKTEYPKFSGIVTENVLRTPADSASE